MQPIRILYVNGGIMNRGGIESYMMNYYRNIDRSKIQIDFVVHGFDKGVYDDEIKSMGGVIYNVPIKSKDYLGNKRELKKIFLSGKYKIVHSHMDAMNMVVLKLAKQCNIPIRIAHSHNTQHLTNNRIKFLINEYARKNINKYATHFFACSDDAGKWLYGEKLFLNGQVKIIKNAIDLNQFRFDLNKRNKFRKELKLRDEFVIGHVGRFDYQKNHLFLLELFKKVLEYIPNSKLVLVGDGYLKNKLLSKINELNLDDKVIMLGSRANVNEMFNIFDMFILPSIFEGLGIVGIEAQANGLNCVMSDVIPSEVKIIDKVKFISLNEEYLLWVKEIINIKNSDKNRGFYKDLFNYSGYNIKLEVKKLENLYLKLMGEF